MCATLALHEHSKQVRMLNSDIFYYVAFLGRGLVAFYITLGNLRLNVYRIVVIARSTNYKNTTCIK